MLLPQRKQNLAFTVCNEDHAESRLKELEGCLQGAPSLLSETVV